jgi:hypothetical protein
MNKLFSLLLFSLFAYAGYVYDAEYQVVEEDRFTIIYAPEYTKEADYASKLLPTILELYEKQYGYALDDKITLVLVSQQMQIANGFSTQTPTNETVLYSNGAEGIDYFSSTSWLDTLLYHELAHSYQMNAKENAVSPHLKTYFGNNIYPLFIYLPLFTFPNQMLPMMLYEGNSVLNESKFGNGGRLYSGKAKALLMALIKDNRLTPSRLINSHEEFPYYEEKYLVGGFFTAFLEEKYRISDRLFKEHSKHFINPFFTQY